MTMQWLRYLPVVWQHCRLFEILRPLRGIFFAPASYPKPPQRFAEKAVAKWLNRCQNIRGKYPVKWKAPDLATFFS